MGREPATFLHVVRSDRYTENGNRATQCALLGFDIRIAVRTQQLAKAVALQFELSVVFEKWIKSSLEPV